MSTQIKNVCPLDCPDTCSMIVTVRDGVAVDLRGDPDHRFTRGFLCQKMARFLDRVYSPDRVLLPRGSHLLARTTNSALETAAAVV
jgi:anaerobic selenocysteine-containing dehydrogenase